MNSYKTALRQIIKNKFSIKNEWVNLNNSLNRVVANDIISKVNYPSGDNTAFDGFAVSSKETKNLKKNRPQKFKIIKTLAAGDNPNIKKIPKFSAIEVMTGAIIQRPFDTIIPVEEIEYYPNKEKAKFIIVKKKLKKLEYIRPKGSDYKAGEKIINKGQLVNASHILALKTLGIDKVLVKKKVNIVFYPTGKELSNEIKIPNWKIRNSNTAYLNSLVRNLPINFKTKMIIRDNHFKLFKNELGKNIKSKTDIIITSGAVSAGKFDFIPTVIKQFKTKSIFKGVKIRPGKPIMFAKFKNNTCFFGLPGNPISSVACFRFFVMPIIFKSLGLQIERPIIAKLKNNFNKKKNFTRFIKGRIDFLKNGTAQFEIFKGQESYRINPFTKSNAWGVFRDGKSQFKKGNFIECYSSTGLNDFLI